MASLLGRRQPSPLNTVEHQLSALLPDTLDAFSPTACRQIDQHAPCSEGGSEGGACGCSIDHPPLDTCGANAGDRLSRRDLLSLNAAAPEWRPPVCGGAAPGSFSGGGGGERDLGGRLKGLQQQHQQQGLHVQHPKKQPGQQNNNPRGLPHQQRLPATHQRQQQQQGQQQQAPAHQQQQQQQQQQHPPQQQLGAADDKHSAVMRRQQDNATTRQAELHEALEAARSGLSGLLAERALLMKAAARCGCAAGAAAPDGADAGDAGGGRHAAAGLSADELRGLRQLIADQADSGACDSPSPKGAAPPSPVAAAAPGQWLSTLSDLVARHAAEAQGDYQQLSQQYLILTRQLGIPACAVPQAAWQAAAPAGAAGGQQNPQAAMAIPSDVEQVRRWLVMGAWLQL
jgi:hypothetical protein